MLIEAENSILSTKNDVNKKTNQMGWPVPEPDPLPGIFSIPDPTRFLFENHWVAGNLKFQVLPYISGIPRNDWVLGIPQ